MACGSAYWQGVSLYYQIASIAPYVASKALHSAMYIEDGIPLNQSVGGHMIMTNHATRNRHGLSLITVTPISADVVRADESLPPGSGTGSGEAEGKQLAVLSDPVSRKTWRGQGGTSEPIDPRI